MSGVESFQNKNTLERRAELLAELSGYADFSSFIFGPICRNRSCRGGGGCACVCVRAQGRRGGPDERRKPKAIRRGENGMNFAISSCAVRRRTTPTGNENNTRTGRKICHSQMELLRPFSRYSGACVVAFFSGPLFGLRLLFASCFDFDDFLWPRRDRDCGFVTSVENAKRECEMKCLKSGTSNSLTCARYGFSFASLFSVFGMKCATDLKRIGRIDDVAQSVRPRALFGGAVIRPEKAKPAIFNCRLFGWRAKLFVRRLQCADTRRGACAWRPLRACVCAWPTYPCSGRSSMT